MSEEEDRPDHVERPVLIVPGIVGTLGAGKHMEEWFLTRGIEPERPVSDDDDESKYEQVIEVDPLGGYYYDLIVSLENVGYALDETLFIVTYDWRLPVGPYPESADDFDGTVDVGGAEERVSDIGAQSFDWSHGIGCEMGTPSNDTSSIRRSDRLEARPPLISQSYTTRSEQGTTGATDGVYAEVSASEQVHVVSDGFPASWLEEMTELIAGCLRLRVEVITETANLVIGWLPNQVRPIRSMGGV
ncbi:hypothetical protein [Natronorarus salvus]|uniref:hypothetical protein n=1 Tax=Natronorarus salvus TaxID=3117733 RepID=UPI002F267E5F